MSRSRGKCEEAVSREGERDTYQMADLTGNIFVGLF